MSYFNLICRNSDVCNSAQLISAYCRLPLTFFFLLFSLYRIITLHKHRVVNSVIKIHLCILLWSVAFIAGDTLKIISYLKISPITNYSQYPTWVTNIMPRWYTYLDVATGALITTLLILCPYYWIKNILFFLMGMSSTEHKSHRSTSIFLKLIYGYLILTRALLFLGLISLFFVPYTEISPITKTYSLFLALQSILNIALILKGRSFLITNFQKLAITDNSTSNKMRTQTNYLIFISTVRVVHNIVMTVLQIFEKGEGRDWEQGLCREEEGKLILQDEGYLVV